MAAQTNKHDLDDAPASRPVPAQPRMARIRELALRAKTAIPAVWGIGNTEREALADAAQQNGYEATPWQCVVSISDVRAARIESGDVSADDLVTNWQNGRRHEKLFPAEGHDPMAGRG